MGSAAGEASLSRCHWRRDQREVRRERGRPGERAHLAGAPPEQRPRDSIAPGVWEGPRGDPWRLERNERGGERGGEGRRGRGGLGGAGPGVAEGSALTQRDAGPPPTPGRRAEQGHARSQAPSGGFGENRPWAEGTAGVWEG